MFALFVAAVLLLRWVNIGGDCWQCADDRLLFGNGEFGSLLSRTDAVSLLDKF